MASDSSAMMLETKNNGTNFSKHRIKLFSTLNIIQNKIFSLVSKKNKYNFT